MSAWKDRIARFRELKIVVLGDLVADVYISGTTSRISREAPVLVVCEEGRETRLGGAANVAANIRALGGIAVPVGLVGDDGPGLQLLERFAASSVPTSSIVVDTARFTTSKTRVLAGGQNTVRQQMLRIDRVNNDHPNKEAQAALLRNLEKALVGAAALVVSDYGEGVVEGVVMEEVLRLGCQGSIPVFADSRFKVRQFVGVRAQTPNEPELAEATGLDLSNVGNLEQAGRLLLQQSKSQSVLVKRGRNGMALFLPGADTILLPAFGSEEVADVTGAGDTVIAGFALAQAAGVSPGQAMHLANTAGGIKVTKSGTAVVGVLELEKALMSQP